MTADSATPGQRIDPLLDFLGIDVEAAGDDQVLRAADDADVAVREDLAHVAGAEPAVGRELLACLLGHPPIAAEDVRPLDLDAADALRRDRCVVVADDAHRHAGQRRTDGAGDPLAGERVRRVHPGLRHAVALEDRVPRAPLGIRRRCRAAAARSRKRTNASTGSRRCRTRDRRGAACRTSARPSSPSRAGSSERTCAGSNFASHSIRAPDRSAQWIATNSPCTW